MILIIVTTILITVTTIPTMLTNISNILMYLSLYFPSVSPPNNTGSSQNVLILAKGEPLTVLAAPENIITDRKYFENINFRVFEKKLANPQFYGTMRVTIE